MSIWSGATTAATRPHTRPITGAGRSPDDRHASTASTANNPVSANCNPSNPSGRAVPTSAPITPGITHRDWQVIAMVSVRGPLISARRLVDVIA